MIKKIVEFYRISAPSKNITAGQEINEQKRYKRLRWSTFLAATVG